MDIPAVGRLLIVVGLVVVFVGVAFVVGARFGLGRLPGDLSFSWGNAKVFVPLATSLVLSLVLSVVLTLLLRR